MFCIFLLFQCWILPKILNTIWHTWKPLNPISTRLKITLLIIAHFYWAITKRHVLNTFIFITSSNSHRNSKEVLLLPSLYRWGNRNLGTLVYEYSSPCINNFRPFTGIALRIQIHTCIFFTHWILTLTGIIRIKDSHKTGSNIFQVFFF